MANIPAGLQYWTADEIAECLDVPDAIYEKLWGLATCSGGKPLGGDGSEDTWEWPELVDSFANQPNHFWPLFSVEEQEAIADAYLHYMDPPLNVRDSHEDELAERERRIARTEY